jgi:2-desacetyl-2-hydroxyethyl bacteriochlorophyllide A dehydrogenase
MLAAQYMAPHSVKAVEAEIPSPTLGEALIRVSLCGICGTDLAIEAGKHPRARPGLIMGHEFCGKIVEINATGSEFRVGDQVTVYPLITCGNCLVCRTGNPHVCRDLKLYGIDAPGGMAAYVALPLDVLLKLPDSMPAKAGALLEPYAVGIHAVRRSPVQPDDTVVVMGAGPIGLLNALALKTMGVEKVYVTDINAFRLGLAEKSGLIALDASNDDPVETIREVTDGEGADVVFEAAGSQSAAAQMTEMVRCHGAVINVSVFKTPPEIDMRSVNFKELTVIGTRVYTVEDFRTAIDTVEQLPVETVVTHQLPLAGVTEAFEIFKAGVDVCKVLVDAGE